jgi:predicted small secreted protein
MKRIPITLVVLLGLVAGGCGNTWDGIKKDTGLAGEKIKKTGDNIYIEKDKKK